MIRCVPSESRTDLYSGVSRRSVSPPSGNTIARARFLGILGMLRISWWDGNRVGQNDNAPERHSPSGAPRLTPLCSAASGRRVSINSTQTDTALIIRGSRRPRRAVLGRALGRICRHACRATGIMKTGSYPGHPQSHRPLYDDANKVGWNRSRLSTAADECHRSCCSSVTSGCRGRGAAVARCRVPENAWHITTTPCRGRDLNPRPQGYEPCELPGCSTPISCLPWGAVIPRLGSLRASRIRDQNAGPDVACTGRLWRPTLNEAMRS